MGHKASSPSESEDLSFENGRRSFLTDDELRRGRSNSSISCKSPHASVSKTEYKQVNENICTGSMNNDNFLSTPRGK